jgi:hypothetical protein
MRVFTNITSICCAAAVLLGGCNVEQYEPINVAVYPSMKICSIKETPVDCAKVGPYIRDVLKAAANRDVTVSYAGTETVEKGDTSVEQIGERIKATGYKNVRVIRYEMK